MLPPWADLRPATQLYLARPELTGDFGPPLGPVTEWYSPDGSLMAKGNVCAEGVWIDVIGVARYALGSGDTAVTAVPVEAASDSVVAGSFRRFALPLLLQAHGFQGVHASAVATPAGVVALCAVSGTGKSTAAATLARLGYVQWADDVVIFAADGTGTVSFSLPFSPGLDDDARALVSSLPAGPQRITQPLPDQLPLVGVIALSRTDERETTVQPLSPVHAFTTLLEHGLCFSLDVPHARRRLSQSYLAVVTAIPILHLEFRPGSEQQYKEYVDLLVKTVEGLPGLPS